VTLSPWTDRLELGEGPRWVDGRLVLVDILAGRLLADDGTPDLKTLAQLPVPLGAVAPIHGAPDTWIAAAGTGVGILSHSADTPSADITWIAQTDDAADDALTPTMRVNDAVADPNGRLWFGTMAYDGTEDAGSLYRVDHDGTLTQVLDRITIPNGPAFTEDGSTMYLADSGRGLVHRYDVDPTSGRLGAPILFADFADVYGGPDGMCVDREGNVWIANWGGGTVRRHRPDGSLDSVVELPVAQPAGVCLGGEDGHVLHITTATHALKDPGPLDGAVLTVRVDVPGYAAATFRPTGRVAEIVEEHRSADSPNQAPTMTEL
jgi:sugar lactone lactonase YvrE